MALGLTPTAPPRLLMTADAVGGVWTYALDLARGLGRAGVETLLVVLGPQPSDDQRAVAAAIAGLELMETGLPLDWTATEPAEILEVGAVIRGLARGRAVDLVHLNSPILAADLALPIPALGVCHSCLATWWSAVREGPMPPAFAWRTHMLWRGLGACDALIAPSAAFSEETARTYDVPRPLVVHNGRAPDPDEARAPPSRESTAFVFTAGRLWDAGKNVALIDAAAGRLSVPVLAAGPLEGPSGERVGLRHARSLGSISAEAVARWMGLGPVFVSTALYEPFGLAVLEAAQAGCPLVLSDIPTFRELWDEAAVFVAPDDAAGLAAALRGLTEDPRRAERLGAAARRRARNYGLEAMTAGVLDVYRRLAPDRFLIDVREAAA